MPLEKGKSDAARSANIATEIKAGKPAKQAEAIGYAVQRKAKDSKMGKDSAQQQSSGGTVAKIGRAAGHAAAHVAAHVGHAVEEGAELAADSEGNLRGMLEGLRKCAADCMAYDRKRK